MGFMMWTPLVEDEGGVTINTEALMKRVCILSAHRFEISRGLLAMVLLLGLSVPGARIEAEELTGPPPLVDLDDVFEPDLSTWLSMSLLDFCPEGPAPVFNANFTKIERTGHGCTFEAYHSSVDPFTDPNAPTTLVSSRTTVELYMPADIDFTDTVNNWILVWKTPRHLDGEPEPEGTRKRRIFARKASEKGIPVCLWFDHDRYPKGGGAETDSVPVQLGSSEGALARDGFAWMMRKDPAVTPLEKSDFTRLWRHYGIGQQHIVATTFCLQLVVETYGAPAQPWVDSIKTMVADGSKGVAGVTAASGVDPRIKAVRFSGVQEFNGDDTGAARRYETDWGECAGGQHLRAAFGEWSYENRFESPSYFDIHVASFDPDRYCDKLWLDVIATHDWSTPLASHASWWDARDGLIGGVVDPLEKRWDFRLIRRPNANHGISYGVGFRGNFAVEATDLLLWRTVRSLVLATELPRCEVVSVDVSNPSEWSARIRVTNADLVPTEEFNAWVLLSDDRDTRRCDPPIVSVANGNCFDGVPGVDDNKEEEDKFLKIPVNTVVVDGEFRDVTWTPPTELLAFTPDPMIAVYIEFVARGPVGSQIIDDTWVHTEVTLKNASQYADQTCP